MAMDKKIALGFAAQAWCEPETEHLVMEPALAGVFADILVARCAEEVMAYRLARARAELAVHVDPVRSDWYDGLIANMAVQAEPHLPPMEQREVIQISSRIARNMLAVLMGQSVAQAGGVNETDTP